MLFRSRSPLHTSNPGVNAIQDDEEELEFDSWIYPMTDGGLNNWTVKDYIPVTFVTQ